LYFGKDSIHITHILAYITEEEVYIGNIFLIVFSVAGTSILVTLTSHFSLMVVTHGLSTSGPRAACSLPKYFVRLVYIFVIKYLILSE
jgi:hypothetical protein